MIVRGCVLYAAVVDVRHQYNIIKKKKEVKKRVSFDSTDSEAPSSSFINTSPGNPLNIYILTFDASGGCCCCCFYDRVIMHVVATVTAQWMYNTIRRYTHIHIYIYTILSSSTSKRWWNIERHTPLTPFTRSHPIRFGLLRSFLSPSQRNAQVHAAYPLMGSWYRPLTAADRKMRIVVGARRRELDV